MRRSCPIYFSIGAMIWVDDVGGNTFIFSIHVFGHSKAASEYEPSYMPNGADIANGSFSAEQCTGSWLGETSRHNTDLKEWSWLIIRTKTTFFVAITFVWGFRLRENNKKTGPTSCPISLIVALFFFLSLSLSLALFYIMFETLRHIISSSIYHYDHKYLHEPRSK